MVSTSVIASLAFYTMLPLLFCVAIVLLCRGRMTLSVRNILVGAGTFYLFSAVLESLLHAYVLKGNAVTVNWLSLHPYGYALYACLAAGLFEETGRYLAMRFLVKDTGSAGTPVAYGLGHGGIEAVLIGSLGLLQVLALAVSLSMGHEAELSATLGPQGLARLQAFLQNLPHNVLTMAALERLSALVFHIGISFVVWRAVKERQLMWVVLAVVLHAALDFPVGLSQVGEISHAAVMTWILAVGGALAATLLYGLLRKSAPVVAVPAHA